MFILLLLRADCQIFKAFIKMKSELMRNEVRKVYEKKWSLKKNFKAKKDND